MTASTTDNKAGAPSSEEIQQLESFAIDANNTATTAISNEAAIAVEEERLGGKDDISSLTSIPIPLVTNNFTFDGVNVNITSHKSGQEVPVGNLTIVGYSSDNLATNCTVYVSWDSQTPLQIAKALGPAGTNDYSTWSFTYTPAYHAIRNGTNELIALISC